MKSEFAGFIVFLRKNKIIHKRKKQKNDGKHENYYARKSPDFSGDTD